MAPKLASKKTETSIKDLQERFASIRDLFDDDDSSFPAPAASAAAGSSRDVTLPYQQQRDGVGSETDGAVFSPLPPLYSFDARPSQDDPEDSSVNMNIGAQSLADEIAPSTSTTPQAIEESFAIIADAIRSPPLAGSANTVKPSFDGSSSNLLLPRPASSSSSGLLSPPSAKSAVLSAALEASTNRQQQQRRPSKWNVMRSVMTVATSHPQTKVPTHHLSSIHEATAAREPPRYSLADVPPSSMTASDSDVFLSFLNDDSLPIPPVPTSVALGVPPLPEAAAFESAAEDVEQVTKARSINKDYVKEFDDAATKSSLTISKVPKEALLKKQRELDQTIIQDTRRLAKTSIKREADLLWRENAARERVIKMQSDTLAEIGAERARVLDELEQRETDVGMEFRRTRELLEEELEAKKAVIKERFGELSRDDKASVNRVYHLDWSLSPQPIEMRVHLLRAVKNKLPKGSYVIVLSQYDRLGGNPMTWSTIGSYGIDKDKPGATRPFRHQGRFFDRVLRVEDSVFALCPPNEQLRPGNVFIIELFQLASRRYPVHKLVAWGALPLCSPQFAVVEGKFKIPLIRGEHSPVYQHYRTIENAINEDLNSWLCNIYLEIRHLPKSMLTKDGGVVDEYEVEFDFIKKKIVPKPIYHDMVASGDLEAQNLRFDSAIDKSSGFDNSGSKKYKMSTMGSLKEVSQKTAPDKLAKFSIDLSPKAIDDDLFDESQLGSSISPQPSGVRPDASAVASGVGKSASLRDRASGSSKSVGAEFHTAPTADPDEYDSDTQGKSNRDAGSWGVRSIFNSIRQAFAPSLGADADGQRLRNRRTSRKNRTRRLPSSRAASATDNEDSSGYEAREHADDDDDEEADDLEPLLERGYNEEDKYILESQQMDKLSGLDTIADDEERRWASTGYSKGVVKRWQSDGSRYDSEAGRIKGLFTTNGKSGDNKGTYAMRPSEAKVVGHFDNLEDDGSSSQVHGAPSRMYSKYYVNRDVRAAGIANTDQDSAGLAKAGGHSLEASVDLRTLQKNYSSEADAALRHIGEIDSRGRYSTWIPLHTNADMEAFSASLVQEPWRRRKLQYTALVKSKLRYLYQEMWGDFVHNVPYSSTANSSWCGRIFGCGFFGGVSIDLYASIIVHLCALWIRMALHYIVQYFTLTALNIPTYDFRLYVYEISYKFVSSSVPASYVVATVVAGPLGLIVAFGVLMVLCKVYFSYIGNLPEQVSVFMAAFGLYTILDPLLILFIDLAVAHNFACTTYDSACAEDITSDSCTCFTGDAFKLYYKYDQDEGSGMGGIFITIILYSCTMVLAGLLVYEYMVHIHHGARIVDVWRRLNAPAEDLVVPLDFEISIDELESICTKARHWKGPAGSTRRVVVSEYIETDPYDSNYRSVTKHYAIYELTMDMKRKLYRHFLWMDDGDVIIEIFDQLSTNLTSQYRALEGLLGEVGRKAFHSSNMTGVANTPGGNTRVFGGIDNL